MKDKQYLMTCLEKYPQLRLLVLFGSQSRGDATKESDWDFGFIANPNFDSDSLYTDLVLILKTEKIDLVDLSHANGLLRFRAARDGMVLFEKTKNEYEKFWLQAVNFWCDAGPMIRSGYDAILGRLK